MEQDIKEREQAPRRRRRRPDGCDQVDCRLDVIRILPSRKLEIKELRGILDLPEHNEEEARKR